MMEQRDTLTLVTSNPGPELDIKIYMFFFAFNLKGGLPSVNPKAPGRALVHFSHLH
jgi:hypothetical protein